MQCNSRPATSLSIPKVPTDSHENVKIKVVLYDHTRQGKSNQRHKVKSLQQSVNTETGQQRKGTMGKIDPLAGGNSITGKTKEQRSRERDVDWERRPQQTQLPPTKRRTHTTASKSPLPPSSIFIFYFLYYLLKTFYSLSNIARVPLVNV